jgi:RimJ/RimL family protein N-acetyltransferase
MATIFETDRLLLREVVTDDVENFFRKVREPEASHYKCVWFPPRRWTARTV